VSASRAGRGRAALAPYPVIGGAMSEIFVNNTVETSDFVGKY
jgi:hypothetical protein